MPKTPGSREVSEATSGSAVVEARAWKVSSGTSGYDGGAGTNRSRHTPPPHEPDAERGQEADEPKSAPKMAVSGMPVLHAESFVGARSRQAESPSG